MIRGHLPALLLPEWTFRMVVALLILGFPLALGLAWSFDLTSEGVQRTDAEDDLDASDTRCRTGVGGRRGRRGRHGCIPAI